MDKHWLKWVIETQAQLFTNSNPSAWLSHLSLKNIKNACAIAPRQVWPHFWSILKNGSKCACVLILGLTFFVQLRLFQVWTLPAIFLLSVPLLLCYSWPLPIFRIYGNFKVLYMWSGNRRKSTVSRDLFYCDDCSNFVQNVALFTHILIQNCLMPHS